ncbi:MAG: hypothetical protein KKH98_06125 [Spirochaetes bacterium]|nr:hypothetical protein [Spirochaetota bacterium]
MKKISLPEHNSIRSWILFALIFSSFLFYAYRNHIELKSRNASFILEYNALLHYYNDSDDTQAEFLDELLRNKILNVFINPSVISDLTGEYNDIMLLSGRKLRYIFSVSSGSFRDEYTYLIIPLKYKDIIINIPLEYQKSRFKDNMVYEFKAASGFIQNVPVVYRHIFEEILIKKGFNLINLHDKIQLTGIDNYLIKEDDKYFLRDKPEEGELILKSHKFNKMIHEKREIRLFIDENHRAVMERNVKGIIIPVLSLHRKTIPLHLLIKQLREKLEKKNYRLTRSDRTGIDVNRNIIFAYRILILLLSGALIFFMFPGYKYYFLILLLLTVMVNSLFASVPMVFLLCYLLNEYILKKSHYSLFNVKNLVFFIGAVFSGCIIISNYIWDPVTFFDPHKVPAVKFMFLLPLILWPVHYFLYLKHDLKAFLKTNINVMMYSLLTLLFILISFILLRTGNYYLSVSSVELDLRQYLESFFYIRPRFKEIIFYPFLLILFTGYGLKIVKKNFFLIYLFSLIAVSTTINSFLHVHTLSYYSFIRSLTGIGIGFFSGIIILLLLRSFEGKSITGLPPKVRK